MGLIGGYLKGAQSAKYAKSQRAWSKRRYAERYQVAAQDMIKAGLNPIMMAGGGPGAAPAGVAGQAGDMSPNADIAQTASKIKLEQDQREKMDQERRVMLEQIEKLKSDREVNNATVEQKNAEIENTNARTQIHKLSFPGLETEAAIDSSGYGKALRYINRAASSISPLLSGLTGGLIGRGLRKRNRGPGLRPPPRQHGPGSPLNPKNRSKGPKPEVNRGHRGQDLDFETSVRKNIKGYRERTNKGGYKTRRHSKNRSHGKRKN